MFSVSVRKRLKIKDSKLKIKNKKKSIYGTTNGKIIENDF